MHDRENSYENHEDAEYHFSDDQANYEVEPEEGFTNTAAVKEASPTVTTAPAIQQYKRPLIAIAIFFVLTFLVYKITAPSSTQSPGDFAANTAPAPGTNTAAATKTATKTAQTTTTATSDEFKPLSQPTGMSSTTPNGVNNPAPPTLAQQAQAASPAPVVSAPPMSSTVAPLPPPALPAASTTTPEPSLVISSQPVYNPAHPTNDASSLVAEPAELVRMEQKVTMLTQQNAKMQADYAQRIADYEAQNSALQNKVQDLNGRLANLETTLAHLGRAMQDTHGARAEMNGSGSPAQVMMQPQPPKIAYSVQAIIPGRAWLKSENGDTVTVAEGDILKGYGKIVKIDPYDGIVELDVGGRLVPLTYGATSE